MELSLEREDMSALALDSGRQLHNHLTQESPRLILLDLRLPDADGMTLTRDVRRTSTVPIIIITGASRPGEAVEALDHGADDFVAKPFDPAELMARIRAVLRRCENRVRPVATEARFGGWVLDLDRRLLLARDGEPCRLTEYEYRLLESLVAAAGSPLSRRALLARLQGIGTHSDDRVVDVHVRNLRRKLEADTEAPQLIRTVRNIGYMLVGDVVWHGDSQPAG